MTVRDCMLAVALTLLAGNDVYAQFVPLEAKIRETHETLSSGKVVKSEVKEGSFYRASDGSTLTQWQTVNGEKSSAANLFDNKGQATYQIDYQQRRALKLGNGADGPMKPGGYQTITKDIGTSSVEGVACRLLPVKMTNPATHALADIGKSCVSPEYDLLLWWDVTTGSGGNGTFHSKWEIYDLKLGAEPDPKLFSTTGMTIIGPPQKSSPQM